MHVKTTQETALFLNEKKHQLFRRENQAQGLTPLDWLEQACVYPKWYMRSGVEDEYAACGSLLSFSQIPTYSLSQTLKNPPRIIGGQDFFGQTHKTTVWKGFPQALYSLPIHESFSDKSVYTNSFTTDFSEYATQKICPISPPLLRNRYDIPSKESWCESLSNCIAAIKEEQYKKIVLARAACFSFSSRIPLFDLLRHLRKKSVNSIVFMIALSDDLAFVGATPEYLFRRTSQEINTHAIAGTRVRGDTVEQDKELEKELLQSGKEQSEFSAVFKDIEKVLSPLCDSLEMSPQTEIIKTATLQHLLRRFRGKLLPGITTNQILSLLHPTPAVGGDPRKLVLQKIYELETFDRGWYAAPFGYCSDEVSKVVVAIRSALIREKTLTAFAGTGIVSSSDPHLEWEELNNKISQFVQWIR